MSTRMTEAPGFTRESAMVERRLRHKASRLGYRLHKSRKPFGIDNHGHFTVIETAMNACVLGPRFDATLDEIEAWLMVRATKSSSTKGIPSPEEYEAMQAERYRAAVSALVMLSDELREKAVIEAKEIVRDGERQLAYLAEMDELRKRGDDDFLFSIGG